MVINNYLLPIHAQKMVSAFIPYSVPNSVSFCVPRFTRYQGNQQYSEYCLSMHTWYSYQVTFCTSPSISGVVV